MRENRRMRRHIYAGDAIYYRRTLDLKELLNQGSHFSFGPRQCGKTALIRSALLAEDEPSCVYLNLLDTDLQRRLMAQPSRLREYVDGAKTIVIDEIQKIPQLLDEVHNLISSNGLTFLLTGSSARKLRENGVNLLGGRAWESHLFPFTSDELGEKFELERALRFGTLPPVYLSPFPSKALKAYVSTYLEQEIRLEGLVRSLPSFSRFLEVAAHCHAQLINYSKISNDCEFPKTTVQEYFQILRDTLIGSDLPVWGGSTTRKASKTSKFFFFDIGVVREILDMNRTEIPIANDSFAGISFESIVYQELKAYSVYRGLPELCFFRTPSKLEVDFILNDNTAIEVKLSKSIVQQDLKTLISLQEDPAIKKTIVVCREPRPRRVSNVDVWPIGDFLRNLWADKITHAL